MKFFCPFLAFILLLSRLLFGSSGVALCIHLYVYASHHLYVFVFPNCITLAIYYNFHLFSFSLYLNVTGLRYSYTNTITVRSIWSVLLRQANTQRAYNTFASFCHPLFLCSFSEIALIPTHSILVARFAASVAIAVVLRAS